MRRIIDIIIAVCGLIVLSPMFVLIAAAIKMEDNGPIFYCAKRAGIRGRVFLLYKFRTMVLNADQIGGGITTAQDRRITKTGAIIRKLKLDEFPQLINIIRGEMKLVGPRPEDPLYTKIYSTFQKQVLNVYPGITSPASLYYKDEAALLNGPDWEEKYIKEILPHKIELDIEYFKNNSLWSDFALIIQTIFNVLNIKNTWAVILLLMLCLSSFAVAQTQILPLEHQLNARLYRSLYNREHPVHSSIQPYELGEISGTAAIDSVITTGRVWDQTFEGWVGRKLVGEHLLEVSENDYRLFADFIPDLTLGTDISISRSTNLNTRGFAAGGTVTPFVSFTSEFYENQAKFPEYIDGFVRKYSVVPGQAYRKLYGAQSFDFAYSTAILSIRPSKYLGIQAGQGKNFIGDGYRSMLLSDEAFNYPFLKLTADVWKIKYICMWTEFQDVTDRKRLDKIPWAKKSGVFHYLDMNVSSRLSIGLFEGIIWLPQDSASNRGLEWNYLNPIIFMRPVEFSLDSPDNVLMGVNWKYLISNRTALYGQVMLDEMTINEYFTGSGYWGNKYGLQFGVKSFEPLNAKNLYLQTEFNCASPYTYSHRDPRKNYGHYNQSLAHPLGANFYESVSIAQYSAGRFDFYGQFNLARYGDDSSRASYGKDIYKSYDTRVQNYGVSIGQGVKSDLMYADLRIAYVLNPLTNLRFEFGTTYRRLHSPIKTEESMVFSFGLRSSFRNLYYDF